MMERARLVAQKVSTKDGSQVELVFLSIPHEFRVLIPAVLAVMHIYADADDKEKIRSILLSLSHDDKNMFVDIMNILIQLNEQGYSSTSLSPDQWQYLLSQDNDSTD